MTLKDQIAALHAGGMSEKRIAVRVGRSKDQVRATIFKIDNPERAKEWQRVYDANRYGTKEYNKKERERRKRRYHADPIFRLSCIAASARYKEKVKA